MLQGVVGATHHDPAGGLEWVSDELGRRRRGGKDVKNNFFRFVCVCVCVVLLGWLARQSAPPGRCPKSCAVHTDWLGPDRRLVLVVVVVAAAAAARHVAMRLSSIDRALHPAAAFLLPKQVQGAIPSVPRL